MAVYREGFSILSELTRNPGSMAKENVYVYWVKRGDKTWNKISQLVKSYGLDETRKVYYVKHQGKAVECIISLVDEWAVSDERKTLKEATTYHKVTYFTRKFNSYTGYFRLEILTDKIITNKLWQFV